MAECHRSRKRLKGTAGRIGTAWRVLLTLWRMVLVRKWGVSGQMRVCDNSVVEEAVMDEWDEIKGRRKGLVCVDIGEVRRGWCS